MTNEDISGLDVKESDEQTLKRAKPAAKKKPARKPAKKVAEKSTPMSSDGISTKTGMLFLAAIGVLFLVYYFTSAQQSSLPGSEAQVGVIFLSDQRCGAECDLSRLDGELRKAFPTMIVRSLDLSSDEGRRIYQSTGLVMLPAVLFDKSAKDAKGYSQVSKFIDEAGDYLSLRVGGNWDPYCDPTQDHCSETRCASRISCRTETPKTLGLFIMSQCPYGVQAADSMKEVLSAFGDDIQFSLNFIGQLDTSGNPTSLHGPAEVQEDLREVCAAKYYPQAYKFMEYVWCRNKNMQDPAWGRCANASGLDAEKIRACAEGPEGKALLKESFQQGDSLQIYSSPTFFLNNKKLFGAITAADIQSAYCETNKGLAGCAKTLGNQSSVPAGSCG